MKFGVFKKFAKRVKTVTVDEVLDYLVGDLARGLGELTNGLSKLEFKDNFESFEWSGTIAANTETTIKNQMPRGLIPSKFLIVDFNAGGLSVCRGDTEWNQDQVYLKNTSGSLDAKITVVFLK